MAGSHRPPRHISLLATPLLLLLFVLPWIACLQLLLMPTPVSANTGLNQPDLSFLSIANPNPLYVPPYQPFEDPMAPSPRPRIQRRQSQVQQEQFMGGYCYGQQVFTNATGILTATAFYSNYSNDMNCVWIIEAPQANEVIKVTFDYFHTECGWDYLTFYDGNSTGAPLLAHLCGLRDNYNDTVVSTGNYLTVVFTSDENVDAKGFRAIWESVVPCKYCTQYGNTCSANNTCVCTDKNRYGTLCERNTTGFSGFTPRSFHAAAYDPQRDLMVISGGTSWAVAAMDDVLVYNFTAGTWFSPNITGPSPGPRYAHAGFVANGAFYIYGGIYSIVNGSTSLHNDMWRLDLDIFQWTNITSFGNQPPPPSLWFTAAFHPNVTGSSATNNLTTSNYTIGNYTTRSNSTSNNVAGTSPKLFIFGGCIVGADGQNEVSRQLYVYDINTYTWSYNLRQNSIGTFSSTGIYHPATETLYIFGGLRYTTNQNVFQYHVPSDLWFLGQSQTPNQSRLYNTVALVANDETVFFGGQLPYTEGIDEETNQCYFGEIDVYDLACGSWSASSTPALTSERRMGHSMVIRQDVAWVTGGNNGFDLADMLSVEFPALTTTRQQADQCKALRWCSNYDDCDDCLTRPYCSYCGNICLFDSKKANLETSVSGTCQDLIKEVPSLANSTNVCPPRTLVPLGSQNSGYLALNQFVDFKTFVDNPSANIVFDISTSPVNFTIDFETLNTWQGDINNQNNAILYNRTSVTIGAIIYDDQNMTTLVNISNLLQNYQPLVGTSPNVTFAASDPRRFSGYYIYRLSNPGLNGSSSDNISYTLRVYTSVPGTSQQGPDDGNGFMMGFDLSTFAIFFFTFLVLFCSLVFIARKVRDLLLLRNGRLMWLRTSRERGGEQGETMWPAEVYSILVSRKWWEVEVRNGAERKESDTEGIKESGEMVESLPKLTRLLSQANDMTIVEEPDDSLTQQPQSSKQSIHEIELLRIPSRTTHTLPSSQLPSSVSSISSLGLSVTSARPRRRFSAVSSAASLISRRTATTVNGDDDDAGADGPMAKGKKWVVCKRIKDLKPISVEPFDIATQDDPTYPPSSIPSTSPLVVANFIITLPTPPPPQDHDGDDDDDDYLYMPTLAVATTVLRGPTRSRDDSDSDVDAEDDRWRNETSSDIELGVRKTEGGRRERISTAVQRAEMRRPEQVAAVFRRRNLGAEEDRMERTGWLPHLGERIARLREVVRR